MTKPIKTLLLEAVEDGMETIPGLQTIMRNPSKPIDRDTVPFDMAFIFDDVESVVNRNRIAMNSFPLHIEIWIQGNDGKAISDKADVYQAEIHKMFLTNESIKASSMRIDPDPDRSAEKFYVDEGLGGVILLYKATYSHAWSDPYDAAK
jgi:hypothetical protein